MLMMQPYQHSIQESNEDPPSSSSIYVLHHVLKNVLGLFVDERVFFSNWIKYNNYVNINEVCEEHPCRLRDLQEYSD